MMTIILVAQKSIDWQKDTLYGELKSGNNE